MGETSCPGKQPPQIIIVNRGYNALIGNKEKRKSESEAAQSCPTLCDPMDYEVPPSVGFSRQEYWSGLPFPSPGDLPNPGIEPGSLVLQVWDFTVSATREAQATGKRTCKILLKGGFTGRMELCYGCSGQKKKGS